MPIQKYLVSGLNGSVSNAGQRRGVFALFKLKSILSFPILILVLAIFGFVAFLSYKPSTVNADSTNNTINFQARLENNAGAIVPDGSYNVEFKLYSTPSGGTAEWTEDYTWDSGADGADARVQVVDGYLSVALGSITSFPDTINWNEPQYLTMNIGGTGETGSFPAIGDGEMNPRLQITAVPYAFSSGELSDATSTTNSTLSFATQTASNTLYLPDESGTLCSTGSVCSGYAASDNDASYIQNGDTTQTGASFDIDGTGTIGTSLTTPELQSGSGDSLSIVANASSTWETTVGNLSMEDEAANSILQFGVGSEGTINIGNIGDSTTINVGNDSTSIQTLYVGSTYESSSTTIQGGDGGINLVASGASNSGVLVSSVSTSGSSSAFQVQATGDIAALNVDTANLTTTLRAGTDSAAYGPELNTTSDFTNASAWTSTGWTTSTTEATNASGNNDALSTNQFSLTDGATYQVSYQISGSPTAGSTLAVALGGTTVANYTFTGNPSIDNLTDTRMAVFSAGTPALSFTPSTDFTGTISNVSVKLITPNTNPAFVIQNSSGENNLEIRTSSSTSNLFVGVNNGEDNSTGTNDTSLGTNAAQTNTSGSSNTAIGNSTLQANTTGSQNTAVGSGALQTNVTGIENTALGDDADVADGNLTNATAIGYGAVVSASNTLVLGNTGVTCVIIGASACSNNDYSGEEELGVNGVGIASGGFYTGTPDVAEYIDASPSVGVADVVIADPNNAEAVTTTSTPYDPTAVGVITNGTSGFQMLNPHYGQSFNALSNDDAGALPMAVTGRVPVNVTGEGGPIVPGDYITTSSTAGYGMKADQAGAVIGKALGYFSGTSSSDTGTVLVLIDLSYYAGPNPNNVVQNGGDATLDNLSVTNLNTSGTTSIGDLSVQNVGVSGNLSVSGVTTVATLEVTGDADFGGDVIIGGHIVTDGSVPTITAQTADGQPAQNDLLDQTASATISGDDITGTITITTSDNPTSGDLANIVFAKTFAGTPHVLISGQDSTSVSSFIYPSAESPTGFELSIGNAPEPNTTYTFDYIIAQ